MLFCKRQNQLKAFSEKNVSWLYKNLPLILEKRIQNSNLSLFCFLFQILVAILIDFLRKWLLNKMSSDPVTLLASKILIINFFWSTVANLKCNFAVARELFLIVLLPDLVVYFPMIVLNISFLLIWFVKVLMLI